MESRARITLTARSLGTPALAAFLLAAALCAGERAARVDQLESRLPVPGIGTFHRQLDIELEKLESFVEREGPLDCLVVGSSVVYRGIDPTVVGNAYRRRTGQGIRCFSFGVLGMDEDTAGRLSEILVRRYRPELLVYAAAPFGVDERQRESIARSVGSSPWFQYQAGGFTPVGWLTEHSRAYRLFLPHRNWMQPTYLSQLAYAHVLESATAANGFGAEPDIGRPSYAVPAQAPDCPGAWRYPLSTDRIDGLGRFGQLAANGQRVAVLQMPVPPRALLHCPVRKRELRAATRTVARYAAAHGLEVWRPHPTTLVPHAGWTDAYHMNARGAAVWSRWLGEQMASRADDVRVLAGESR